MLKKYFKFHNYVWHKYIKENIHIYDKRTSIIKDIINTEPEIINVQVCSIQKIIFNIKNPDNEINFLIKNIKSDIYQIKIYPYSYNKSMYNNT